MAIPTTAIDDLQVDALDRLAKAAAVVLGVQIVAISILDGNRQQCVGAHGFAREDRALASTFCYEVAAANRPIIVQDARSRNSPTALHGWGLDLVGYAGVPLLLPIASRHGAIGACSPTRRAWQDRDLEILRAFADAASVVLEIEYASLEARMSALAAETTELAGLASEPRRW
jgi:GAF domain-containing protein